MDARQTTPRGPEWRYFGEPMAPIAPAFLSLAKRPKMIPLVPCAFCGLHVPARSNSLRRHLRECAACSDDARLCCIKQPPSSVVISAPPMPDAPHERSLKATQRRLKNRLACRENRKKKKELRENLKGEVAALCANNATLHGEINALLGFEEPILLPALDLSPASPNTGATTSASELYWKAALFFARYKPGGAVPRHDTPEGSFYSAQTCTVSGDPGSLSAQLTMPGPLEAIWDMKSLLINDIAVAEPELPTELPTGDMQLVLLERGQIRHVRLLHRLFNAATVARIEAAGGAAEAVGEFTWRIICSCDAVRARSMQISLLRYRTLSVH
ncbi:hypothetical protein SDRG_03330 [Saprolegnia diclina VS20]|uniref:BZIP domain-containing protein n=1 Tax=Saprolegnia diclina (strain VS20) TaxID=1156394 RepID=T0S8Y8_SAPDV|nr:hypothetical protein SDRG_03330 [Saprolegnia diclina VS20]EQC39122.1 hypothetical protein SDRG_03330 [Saprolegnia diclina VS20]|eukprot:XP_008607183.1 hypothetical protein SDRG_03330 [Saprolegnia diclina VS20]